jgi:hypothetical protein
MVFALSRFQVPLMLHVVTVDAEQFPVAAIGWIVLMVVVFVMDREFTQSLAREFAAASRTDRWKHFEGSIPVFSRPLFSIAPGLGQYAFQSVPAGSGLFRWHALGLLYV